jgi:hypothetical protein
MHGFLYSVHITFDWKIKSSTREMPVAHQFKVEHPAFFICSNSQNSI